MGILELTIVLSSFVGQQFVEIKVTIGPYPEQRAQAKILSNMNSVMEEESEDEKMLSQPQGGVKS